MRPRFYLLLLCLSWTVLLFADSTGRIRGKIKDANGNPLEGVIVNIDSAGAIKQNYVAHTNAKGEYIHIGIVPGKYKITVSKEGYRATEYIELQVKPSDRPEAADFTLIAGSQSVSGAEQPPEVTEAQAGVALLSEGKVDEAISAFQNALAKNPSLAVVHYNLGVAFERKERMADARKAYQEAIKNNPDFGEAYLALGNGYLAERNFDAPAIDALAKASQLLPESYAAVYNLGVCYSNGGKYQEAEAAFRRASEIDPNEPVVRYQLGMALLGQSKNKEAREAFQKYLELNPKAADRAEVEDLLKTLE